MLQALGEGVFVAFSPQVPRESGFLLFLPCLCKQDAPNSRLTQVGAIALWGQSY